MFILYKKTLLLTHFLYLYNTISVLVMQVFVQNSCVSELNALETLLISHKKDTVANQSNKSAYSYSARQCL